LSSLMEKSSRVVFMVGRTSRSAAGLLAGLLVLEQTVKRNVRILIDRVSSELGIATHRGRHSAFQWRLPPSETSGIDAGGYWDDLAARFRPKNRGWLFGMTSMSEQVYCDWYADKL
jgi:hypothetical protein